MLISFILKEAYEINCDRRRFFNSQWLLLENKPNLSHLNIIPYTSSLSNFHCVIYNKIYLKLIKYLCFYYIYHIHRHKKNLRTLNGRVLLCVHWVKQIPPYYVRVSKPQTVSFSWHMIQKIENFFFFFSFSKPKTFMMICFCLIFW